MIKERIENMDLLSQVWFSLLDSLQQKSQSKLDQGIVQVFTFLKTLHVRLQ
jgi:hypothetical protein